MILLNGKEFSLKFKDNLKEKIQKVKDKYNVTPGLAVVIIGEDPASQIYVKNKILGAEYVGMNSFTVRLSEGVSQEEAENEVIKLANNPDVDGIIVQLPLPKKFDTQAILKYIPTEKDVII